MHRYDQITALAGLVLWLALYSASAISQPAAATGDVTRDTIDATVEAVNGDASLAATTRDDLLVTLAVASKNLDSAAQQLQREKELRQVMEGAPDKIAEFKQQLAATPARKSLEDLVGKAPTLEVINSQVALIETDLRAMKARRDSLQQEIDSVADRNSVIQTRLVELQSKLGGFSAPSVSPDSSLRDRVAAVIAGARAQAWRAEQGSLKAEVLGASSFSALRAAELDGLNHAIDLAGANLETLTDAANFARERETERNLQSIDALEAEVQSESPVLKYLVDANRALVVQQRETSGLMDQATADSSWLKSQLESIRNDARLMRLRLDVAGRKHELGHVMSRLLTSLPDTAVLEYDAHNRNAHISEVSLLMIDTEEQRKQVRKRDSYLQSLGITAVALDGRDQTYVDRLLDQRRQLLDESKNVQEKLSRLLIDNNAQAISDWQQAGGQGYLFKGEAQFVADLDGPLKVLKSHG